MSSEDIRYYRCECNTVHFQLYKTGNIWAESCSQTWSAKALWAECLVFASVIFHLQLGETRDWPIESNRFSFVQSFGIPFCISGRKRGTVYRKDHSTNCSEQSSYCPEDFLYATVDQCLLHLTPLPKCIYWESEMWCLEFIHLSPTSLTDGFMATWIIDPLLFGFLQHSFPVLLGSLVEFSLFSSAFWLTAFSASHNSICMWRLSTCNKSSVNFRTRIYVCPIFHCSFELLV